MCPLFCSDAFINVRTSRIPASYLSLFVPERVVSDQEPTILAILAKRALFGFEWKPAVERGLSLASQSLQVVRMEDSFPKVGNKQIVTTQAGVFQSRLVGIYRRACRVQHDDRLWNRICDAAKVAFIFAEFFLSLLQCFDVGACSIPSNELSGFVAEWLDAYEEPTKDSVVSAKSCFDLSCFSGNQ